MFIQTHFLTTQLCINTLKRHDVAKFFGHSVDECKGDKKKTKKATLKNRNEKSHNKQCAMQCPARGVKFKLTLPLSQQQLEWVLELLELLQHHHHRQQQQQGRQQQRRFSVDCVG